MRNALTYGVLCVLVTGLGAACADAIYGALAGFGVTAISDFLNSYGNILKLVGALFLCYLGFATFRAKPNDTATKEVSNNYLRVFISIFFLTLTNPMTILSFAGIYAGLGIGSDSPDMLPALVMTAGVFLGSAAWWLCLSCVSAIFKDKLNTRAAVWLNRFSGSLIFGSGCVALLM